MAAAFSCSAKVVVAVAACAVVALALLGGHEAEAASCGSYISRLSNCQNYVIGFSNTVDPRCCPQVKALNQQTLGNTPERQAICRCFASYISLLNGAHVTALPGLCGVSLGYKITADPSLCSKVK